MGSDLASSDIIPENLAKLNDRLPGTGAHVEKTANQSFSSFTIAKVTWDNELFDHKGEFDLAADTFTAGRDGMYLIALTYAWTGLADQDIQYSYIYLNGSEKKRARTVASGTAMQHDRLTAILELSEGDDIEFYAQSSAANDIFGDARDTFAQIVYLGPV